MDVRRHLMVFASSSGLAGAEYCLDTTLRFLDRDAWRVTVVFPTPGPMADSARALGHDVFFEPLLWWMCEKWNVGYLRSLAFRSWRRIWGFRRWMQEHKVDLVYTNTAVVFEGAIAAKLAGVPHVWHIHEVLKRRNMHPGVFPVTVTAWLIGKLSDRVIFETNASRDICGALIPRRKSLVVYNSLRLDPSELQGDRVAARRRLEINGNECVVAWAGNFAWNKNPLFLLRAVACMKHKDNVRVILAGGGELEGVMREYMASHGISHQCRLIPFQQDIRTLMQASDLLVLTSRHESFGLVLIEANASGIPVVATRTQGPREVVEDGATGFLIPVDDDAALAARLDLLVADPELRTKMGAAGVKRVNELFSATTNTFKIEQVFRAALINNADRH